MRSRISVPVGALASKSRAMTASSFSRPPSTEKSRSGRKFDGKTSRPWRLMTKGFMSDRHREDRAGPALDVEGPDALRERLLAPLPGLPARHEPRDRVVEQREQPRGVPGAAALHLDLVAF